MNILCMQIRIDYENHTTPFLLLNHLFPQTQTPIFPLLQQTNQQKKTRRKENSLQWDTHFGVFVNGKTHNNNGTQQQPTNIKPYFSLKLEKKVMLTLFRIKNKGAKEPKSQLGEVKEVK